MTTASFERVLILAAICLHLLRVISRKFTIAADILENYLHHWIATPHSGQPDEPLSQLSNQEQLPPFFV